MRRLHHRVAQGRRRKMRNSRRFGNGNSFYFYDYESKKPG
jgi:hypothetical protein